MNGVSWFNATRHRAHGAGLLSVLATLVATVAPAALAADAPATAASGTTPQGESSALQSLLLRAVTVTYDVERSLRFYRDILGPEVVEDVALSAERSRA